MKVANQTCSQNRHDGFSTIELVLSMGLMLVVVASAFTASQSSSDHWLVQTEVVDMHQRLRVAADTLTAELLKVGVGSYAGSTPGALLNYTAAIFPYRSGGSADDPPGTYKTDTMTLMHVLPGSTDITASTYWLKRDEANATYQLMLSSGTSPDVPVVDSVVDLGFEYDGESAPPTMRTPLSDPVGPWTTYGPKPSTIAVPPYAAGENCVFINDRSGTPAPRLPAFGQPDVLLKLAAAELTDGPWCPDSTAPGRWDADLLRIRVVHVSLRVQSGLAALRGPASTLFTRSGTSRRASTLTPDLEIHFQVAPPNLNLDR